MGSILDVCKVVLDRSNPSSTNLWSHSLVKDRFPSMGQKEATDSRGWRYPRSHMSDQAHRQQHWRLCTGSHPLTYLSRTAPRMLQSGSNRTPPGNPRQRPRPGWLMVDIYSTSFQRAYVKLTLMKSHTKSLGEKLHSSITHKRD
jgi:hypothetical protein